MKKILVSILLCGTSIAWAQQIKTFNIDYNSNAGAFKKLTSVNTGPSRASGGTSVACYQNIGVDMVRTHDYHGPCDYWGYSNFFNYFTQMFNYSFVSSNPNDYQWTNTDAQIKEIADAGCTPFFRLGISFPGGGVSPASPMPKDADGYNFRTFAGICKRTAMHYTANWDSGYAYTIPYWELWNEPNHNASWHIDSSKAYFRMYQQVADSMKSFNPALKFGGPGTARSAFFMNPNAPMLTLNREYISNFLHFCDSVNAPLDFYSFHSYNKANPYHIRLMADTISYFLNQSGFDSTELVVSELNRISQDSLHTSPKGCPYLTSVLISALDSRITQIMWYRGAELGALCDADNGTAPNLLIAGYAYRLFNAVCDSTPLRISTPGEEVIKNNINDTTNNLMIVAGKESSNEMVKILVSNLASAHTIFNLSLTNLPWNSTDMIERIIEKVNTGYSISSSDTSGSSNMIIKIPAVTNQSVYLVTLKKKTATSTQAIKENKNDIIIYLDPITNVLNIDYNSSDAIEIGIVNSLGQEMKHLCKAANQQGAQHISVEMNSARSGIYFARIKTGNESPVCKKIVISK